MAEFERFTASLTLSSGKPFALEDFERRIVADYFDGATETVALLPKKNGKSTLMAAVALDHMMRTTGALVPIVAASADQAMWIFDQARGFVERSDELGRNLRVLRGIREIRRRDLNRPDTPKNIIGLMKVLANDEDSLDGVIPTLALVDELHRHRKAETYAVLRDGLVDDGAMITISTAGANLDSPLGALRAQAHALPGFARNGAYRYVRSNDGAFAFHEWALETDDDVDDMDVVKLANPASWQTPERLGRRRFSPSMTQGQWLRFACGIWTEGEEPWIEPARWDDLYDPELIMVDGQDVWLGVDVGVRGDSTAIVAAGLRGQGLGITATIMRPPTTLAQVEDVIRAYCERFRVQLIAYDPWSFRRSAELLAGEGLPIGENLDGSKFPQSPERMSQASACLFQLIETGMLRHDGDPTLRAHVLAGTTRQTERGWRLVKDPSSKRPIDALIAMAMAAYTATMRSGRAEPGYYDLDDEGTG